MRAPGASLLLNQRLRQDLFSDSWSVKMDPTSAEYNLGNPVQEDTVPEGDALNDDSAFLTKKQVVSAGKLSSYCWWFSFDHVISKI